MFETIPLSIGTFFSPTMIFCTGVIGGLIAGFLGIGCGVVITPLLMDLGIPPLIAIPTQLCHAVGTNLTSFLSYKRKMDVDYLLAFYILVGGCIGAFFEWIFLKLTNPQVILHKFLYVYIGILSIFGLIMLYQSFIAWKKAKVKITKYKIRMHKWMLYLPFHKIFGRSRTEMSVLIPIFLGLLTSMLVASLGGGSSIFMTPIIIYLIGRISPVVYGTVSMAGFIITSLVAVVYSTQYYCCDIIVMLLLFAGASIGSWCGVKLTYRISRYYINIISSLVIFFMIGKQIDKIINPKQIKFGTLTSIPSTILEHPVQYTISCITAVIIIAYFYEGILEKISKTRWFRR